MCKWPLTHYTLQINWLVSIWWQLCRLMSQKPVKVSETLHIFQCDPSPFSNQVTLWIIFWGKIEKWQQIYVYRSSHSEVFLRKGVRKICGKFTGEHPCRSAISIKLQSNFIEIALRHGCSSVNLPHIFRTPSPRNTSGWLLTFIVKTM